MKKSFLTLALLCATITTSVAQDITPSKNKFGAILSTNIFGFNDDFNKVDVGGGFFYSRKIANRLSIYAEIDGSWRNYGDVAISPGLSGEFTTGNLTIFIGPMFDIGKKSNLSSGLAQNYLFSSELKTTTGSKDVSSETTNYSSLFFDFRHQISNKISLGTRYEWGLNSMFKSIDRKVSTISFTAIIHFGGNRNQEKSKQ
ncbi:MAG: hypothetical protein O9282_10515 [Flavobacterium sp.]|uniref:hypothetical protein n=1 Tax=Flavobacterium sp. TaxID=239 RepID=UPI0022CC0C42|nr:hypothetical protein [Flavobacterium sp.]MCZ8331732.1 hypothetical protein [Flavobacterium sp.]